ncbi:MAG: hypothetical protein HYX93_06690, partial [Chloroflexi bacterium]|nr:hypothetical protein [Chloroflexota bacterium]
IDGFHGTVVLADVLDEGFPTRHDPMKLAKAIMGTGRKSNGVIRQWPRTPVNGRLR